MMIRPQTKVMIFFLDHTSNHRHRGPHDQRVSREQGHSRCDPDKKEQIVPLTEAKMTVASTHRASIFCFVEQHI